MTRKVIRVDPNQPQSIRDRLGPGVRAYLFGSIATGKAGPDSDIDIYVAGPRANEVESQFMWRRPLVTHDGRAYPLHIAGPGLVSEPEFLRCQPEAIRLF